MVVLQNGCFIMEMDDLGVAPFSDSKKYGLVNVWFMFVDDLFMLVNIYWCDNI